MQDPSSEAGTGPSLCPRGPGFPLEVCGTKHSTEHIAQGPWDLGLAPEYHLEETTLVSRCHKLHALREREAAH